MIALRVARPWRVRRRPSDDGQVLLLILGVAVLCGLLVTVVVDASRLYLERRALVAAADSIALDAAQAIDEAAVYRGGVQAAVPLDPRGVEARVDRFVVAAAIDDRFRDLRVDEVTTDGRGVQVELSARVRLPFLNVVTGEAAGARIVGVARAQNLVGPG